MSKSFRLFSLCGRIVPYVLLCGFFACFVPVGLVFLIVLPPIVSVTLALLTWCFWVRSIVRVTKLASSHGDRLALYLIPFGCEFLLVGCLSQNGSITRQWQWYGVGSFYLSVAAVCFPFWGWGLSPRDDVAERGNRPAGWAIAGAMLALTLAFVSLAEAIVMYQASLSSRPDNALRLMLGLAVLPIIPLFIFWGILEKGTNLSEAITVERDGGAALRLGAFLLGLGLLIGRSFPVLIELSLHLTEEGRVWKQSLTLLGPFALLFVAVLVEVVRKTSSRLPGHPQVIDFVIGLFYLGSTGLWTHLWR